MFLDKKFIGQKLKEYRKKASLSQEQIAEKTGLAEKHYGPALETFFKLIEVLNIPLSEFGANFEDVENKSRVELIKEIYLSSTKEIDAYLNIIKTVKSLK